jgi:hypothetical protein
MGGVPAASVSPDFVIDLVTQIHEKNQVIELLEMKGHKGMQLKMELLRCFFKIKPRNK